MKLRKQILFPKHQRILEIVGENIRLARKRRKLTGIQVSDRADISRNTLYPDIVLFPGPHYPCEKSNFGIFTDSMPDSWGRSMMKRRESQLAKSEGRPAVNLHDSDFLPGVADTTRMGGLRFKLDPGGPFHEDDHLQPVPPHTSIGEMQRIASPVESEKESKRSIRPGGNSWPTGWKNNVRDRINERNVQGKIESVFALKWDRDSPRRHFMDLVEADYFND
jgi:hypothetical protein